MRLCAWVAVRPLAFGAFFSFLSVQASRLFAYAKSSLAKSKHVMSVAKPPPVIIKIVQLFDGKLDTLTAPGSVPVRGNKFEKITAKLCVHEKTAVMGGGQPTPIPRVSEVGAHFTMARNAMSTPMGEDLGHLYLLQRGRFEAGISESQQQFWFALDRKHRSGHAFFYSLEGAGSISMGQLEDRFRRTGVTSCPGLILANAQGVP
jgi:hypothetical protein